MIFSIPTGDGLKSLKFYFGGLQEKEGKGLDSELTFKLCRVSDEMVSLK